MLTPDRPVRRRRHPCIRDIDVPFGDTQLGVATWRLERADRHHYERSGARTSLKIDNQNAPVRGHRRNDLAPSNRSPLTRFHYRGMPAQSSRPISIDGSFGLHGWVSTP